jgi:hypothetical protein
MQFKALLFGTPSRQQTGGNKRTHAHQQLINLKRKNHHLNMDKVELGPSTHIHLKLSDHIVFKLFDIQNSIQYKACGVKFETRAIITKKDQPIAPRGLSHK